MVAADHDDLPDDAGAYEPAGMAADPSADGKGPTQAQILMQMAEDAYRLIRSTDGRTYAVPRLGPNLAVPLASKSGSGIRAKLADSLWRQTGKVATGSALSDCINVLEGEASELDPQPVFLRMGSHNDTTASDGSGDGEEALVVDMGTETGQCIRITSDGWEICPSSPVIFRRSELTHPLVEPVRGGTLDPLRTLVNLSEDDFRLVLGWVVAAYFTDIPHPILLVQGEQGTAKSNLIRCLLALIDPQPAEDRESPADKREWAIFARASWAFSFDNVTDIPDWLSNSLCKGVTGDAVLQRVLHSDEDIAVFSFRRVIAMTTIAIKHDLAGDLTDRMLLVEPEVIEHRRAEADIAQARADAIPDALGAVLDLVAGVVRELPSVQLLDPPRMADFAQVLAAVDTVTGWATLPAYRARVAALGMALIEGNTFARALHWHAATLRPCHAGGTFEPGVWEGTAEDLLTVLRGICERHGLPVDELPKDARAVGRKVREIAPSLRKVGVDIRPDRTNKRRTLRLQRITDPDLLSGQG
ncbi:hypothetical protein ABN028_34920 [Actinopolymorpha sp. B17G11]|uniref:hypothetical protein n=1 Tax=Actinopolymorpha sp. B17G11 TaxID=3160861 RepID=UPI0032E3BA95